MSLVPATIEQQSESRPVSGTIYTPSADEQKARFELMQRQAGALALSQWLPAHLVGKTNEETRANCVGVVQMADKWNMSAQMVAGETYVVKGKVGFQGKLYAALANAHGGLVGDLRIIYNGSGDDRAAVVFGSDHELTQEDKELLKKYVKDGNSDAATDLELSGIRAVRIVLKTVKTDQKMWMTDPEQKLFYTGATKWCRRYMPELVLGAISVEDIEYQDYQERTGGDVSKTERVKAIIAMRDAAVAANPNVGVPGDMPPEGEDGDDNQANSPQDE